MQTPLRSLKGLGVRAAEWAMERTHGRGVWLKHGYSNSPHIGVPPHYPINWWQQGRSVPGAGDFASFGPVAACVSIISQDLARIPLRHVRVNDDGGREIVTNKAPARIFRKPNDYQTLADFILYLVRSLLTDGNAYTYATRNDRFEVDALYPLHPASCWPYLASEGEVFYRVSGDTTSQIAEVDTAEWYTPREIMQIRLQTPKHPLVGESPLVAAVYPTISGTQINAHTAAFFTNMSRPSGILRHPGTLNEEAMKRIKDAWVEVTAGGNTGRPAVLQEAMEWQQLTMTAVDAELAKSYELSERQIWQIFRIPPFLAGDLQKATFTNVESLTRFYVQSCLAFYETIIEQTMTSFFKLPPNEHIEFDVDAALLAGDLKERMEAMGKAIQNGIYSPNEARARERLAPAKDGDEPRVQQQLVPLSFGMNQEPPAPASSAPTPAPVDDSDDAEEPDDEEESRVLEDYRRYANEALQEKAA